MRRGPHELAVDRLRARLSSLRVQGEVLGKKRSTGGDAQVPGGVLTVRFRGRTIELPVGADKLGQTQVGDRIQFSPPVLDESPCNCHCAICMVVGLAIGIAIALAIATQVDGCRGGLLSVVAAGWTAVIAWAVIGSHQRRRHLRDLEKEILFYQGPADRRTPQPTD